MKLLTVLANFTGGYFQKSGTLSSLSTRHYYKSPTAKTRYKSRKRKSTNKGVGEKGGGEEEQGTG